MGNRRIGLGRVEALLENLKREIQLSGSTICALQGASHGSFGSPPVVIDADSTVADGTDSTIHQYPDGLRLHCSALGTQTILIPAAATTGMNYAFDQTDNDGLQWCASMTGHKGHPGVDRFTVGTHGAFYAELKFSIATVAGTDDCAFGFRKVEALQANVDDYDEMAALNVISGNITIETILNNAGTTSTDTTANWADGETHTLRIDVSSAGVVTYKIDGSAPATTAAFTFDSGEVVTPFFFQLQANGAQTGALVLQEVKWGLVGK